MPVRSRRHDRVHPPGGRVRRRRPGADAVTIFIRRLGAFLLEPADPAPSSPPAPPTSSPPTRPLRAAVLGAAAHVPPVAAACAGELRARAGAGSALVCLWRPGESAPDDEDPASPAGATTPGARRVAAALDAEGLRATACGRLAWLALPDDPADAAPTLRRGLALATVPVVIAVAGPRPAAFEPILAMVDLALAVLPADASEPLRALALASLPGTGHILGPLPPGPPRWAALAGLTRLRSLPEAP